VFHLGTHFRSWCNAASFWYGFLVERGNNAQISKARAAVGPWRTKFTAGDISALAGRRLMFHRGDGNNRFWRAVGALEPGFTPLGGRSPFAPCR
jgi:hypothetical protein